MLTFGLYWAINCGQFKRILALKQVTLDMSNNG